MNPEDKKVFVINTPRSDSDTVVVFQCVERILPAGIDGEILTQDKLYTEDKQEVMKL